jgi:hypothetical protein
MAKPSSGQLSYFPEAYILDSRQRDAYYHPTVDSSEEPFKWGSPDLDALRGYVTIISDYYCV